VIGNLQALSSIRIIDLTHLVAGPYCTKLLADFGAEVIKIEKPGGGDKARRMPPFAGDEPHVEKSGLFLYLNTNKKSITLNLKTKMGKEMLLNLVRGADIVVESFAPRVMPSLGLSYETLKEVKEDIIMVSISNFGQTGPYRDYKATELGLLAIGGTLYQTGTPERPVKLGGFQAQYLAGLYSFVASLGAIYGDVQSSGGRRLDISMMECVACFTAFQGWIPYAYMGVTVGREFFKRFVSGHPVGLYRCKDGHVVVVPGLGGMQSLALLLEKPELAEHRMFTSAWTRQDQAKEFDDTFLLPWLKEHEHKEIVETAQELRMPFSELETIDELLIDKQLEERDFFTSSEHPVAGRLTYPGSSFKGGKIKSRSGRAPLLGENNEEIYCGMLGFSKKDLVELKELDII